MKEIHKFSFKSRLKSFRYAFNGLKTLIRYEHNARIHFLAVILIIAMGCYFQIQRFEWVYLLLSFALVISAEALNTAIEYLSDAITLENDERIKKVKDVSACAVLISASISIVIGLIVFMPYIISD